MIALITTSPASALAWMSIRSQYSSRPSPRRPRTRSKRPPTRSTTPRPPISASENSPAPGSSPTQKAMRQATPSATENRGRNQLVLVTLRIEDLLHRRLEVPREPERERERRDVAAGLDRVDRLPRHRHRRRQLRLGDAPRRAPLADVVRQCQVHLTDKLA